MLRRTWCKATLAALASTIGVDHTAAAPLGVITAASVCPLSALARRPDMMGLGIDENTAVLIEPTKALEVIGAGSATIVDCAEMVSNVDEVEDAAKLEMLGMKLHILPSGQRYQVSFGIRTGTVDPGGIHQAIRRLVSPGPIRIA